MKKHREKHLLLFDVCMVIMNYLLAIIIRYDFRYRTALAHEGFLISMPVVGLVFLISFFVTKTNRSLWDKISIEEGFRIVMANALGSVSVLILTFIMRKRYVPGSVIVIAFLLNTLFQETVRFSYRIIRLRHLSARKKSSLENKRVLIYGAGDSGALIAKELTSNQKYNSCVVGFIDDNRVLKGKYVSSHPVFGNKEVLEKAVAQHSVDEIIIAMPSQSKAVQNEIVKHVYTLGLPTRIIPSSEVLFREQNLNKSLKKVELIDLLQRKEIVISDNGIKESLENKRVLITGAAGSIGSELVRQVLKYDPEELTLLDINENGLYSLQQELKSINNINVPINYIVSSIRDDKRVDVIFENGQFDLVFHAAAHKHVPLMETTPGEAIKNNIFGTYNLIESSKKYKVDKFINISTDKAVNPTNVMGATKRFNEMLLQSQTSTDTKFIAVRFGNVLGSNGSVVPLFRNQIAKGGPVTVTHPDITRYFMTIPEAVSLILQAETYACGGEIFVLDMGEPVKILEMAEQIIKLSGFTPYTEIDIEFSGLRPGEKLYEELLMAEEGLMKTDNDLIHIAKPILTPNSNLLEHISKLKIVIDNKGSTEDIIDCLKQAVTTFRDPAEVN